MPSHHRPFNETIRRFETPDDTALLWNLREQRNLFGTRFGCGIGAPGACTVHVDGSAVRFCQLPVAAARHRIRTLPTRHADLAWS